MKVTQVTWFDAFEDASAWTPIDELERQSRTIRSVGFLIPDHLPGHLTLAQSWDAETGCVSQVINIPTVCVLGVD